MADPQPHRFQLGWLRLNGLSASSLTPALAAWLLGTAFQLQQATLLDGSTYLTVLLLGLVLMALLASQGLSQRLRLPLLILAVASVSWSATGWRSTHFMASSLNPALQGRDVTVTGVVRTMPQPNPTGLRFSLAVESAHWQGQAVTLPPRLQLAWYSGLLAGGDDSAIQLQRQPVALVAGERWQMTVRLKSPHGLSNPQGFDFELWLWEQGLQATGYVRAGVHDTPPQRLAQTGWHPVERARQQVREKIFATVDEPQPAGLIAALVVGDQNAIDRADWDVFRATGVAHLMSISGLHITLFAWVAALLIGWLWRRSARLCLRWPAPSAALVGGMLLALAYAVFSGWGVPSQRTVLMLAAVGLLRLSGKRWPWPQVWLLACAVVVLFDPWAMLQAGFWLSFVAVGVLFATDAGEGPSAPPGVKARLAALAREQGVITLALTPLTLLLFGQVSLVGLLANALAIPWVTLVVTPLALLGTLWPALWRLTALALSVLTTSLQWLANLPFATFSVAQAPLWAGVAGLAGGLVLAMPWPRALRALGLPLMLPVLLWQAPLPKQGQFEVLAPDIGQGNALIIRTAHHALVYDAGPRYSLESDAGHLVLQPLLRALGTRVDRLLLSHRDTDHVGGALAVLAMYPQASLLSSIEDGHELQAVRPATRCVAGQHWHWDGVDFDILSPQSADYGSGLVSNAMSCTLRISNGQQSALLAGDLLAVQEARLVDLHGAALKADLLLVPHHGSKTSSSAAFLDAVRPQIALVQTGYRNRFGHPAGPVLARYAERQIELVDSPHCGAATWVSSQPKAVQCHRLEALRYWHHRLP